MQSAREGGQVVTIRRQRWRVERAISETNTTRYDVSRGREHRTFIGPFDRPADVGLTDRPVRVRRRSAFARISSGIAATFGIRSLRRAVDASIDLYPYQLEPALALLAGRRRLLVADAVGLGKTIQAGLGVAELLSRSPTSRILIITPAGLTDQWTDELSSRFGVAARRATALDTVRALDSQAFGDVPWLLPGVWIGSADYLKQPHVLESIPLLPWDMVVVDEAHTAAGASDRHAAVHSLCQRARRVVLLSATPHSGDAADFDRLTSLGAIDAGADDLVIFRRSKTDAGQPRSPRVRWRRVALTPPMNRLFDELQEFETLVRASGRNTDRHDAGALLISVLWRRALSTIPALLSTIERRLAWISKETDSIDADWLQPRFAFDDDDDDDSESMDERRAVSGEIGLPRGREALALGRLTLAAEGALGDDPKLSHVQRLVSRTGEALVVFTEFRRSLEAALGRLGPVRSLAALHGGLTPSERRLELGRFLDGRASVLVTTDVGGQGLNLQSRARWVVNLDLPWNPARLEQRIGRVDRIGQTRPVHATLLAFDHPAEARLRDSLTRRVDAARNALDSTAYSALTAPAHAGTSAELQADRRMRGSAASDAHSSWTRQARAEGKVVRAKRMLASRWRSIDGAGRRPFVVYSARGRSRTLSRPTLVCLRVDIHDATGSPVEQHLVFVGLPASLHVSRPAESALRAMEASARARIAARLRRVRRIASDAAERLEATELALARHLKALSTTRELQLALFPGHRPADVASDAEKIQIDWQGAAQLETLRHSREVQLVAPSVIWIWAR